MGAMLTKCLGSVTNDPKKLQMVVNQCFSLFDKDKSGYIDAAEARACADKVLAMAQITSVSASQIETVFNKVAGADKKLDKAEFTIMVNQLLEKAGVPMVPVPAVQVAPATAVAPAPAATPAATPAPAQH